MAADLADETIEAAWAAGRSAYPALVVALDAFATFARERATTWGGALDRAADLYFACACVVGVAGAAPQFVERFNAKFPSYLGRLGATQDQIDEVRQLVLVRCLLREDERPPAIAGYSGRGSLEGWVRATAVREALALERDRARHVELPAAGVEPPAALDREWMLVTHYREPVARAFAGAAAALPHEHRALLRLHYVHGLTTTDLARMFQVSRATLVRRLTEAREQLFEQLQRELHAHAGVPPEDCESVLRLVRSQVDLRLSSLLRETVA